MHSVTLLAVLVALVASALAANKMVKVDQISVTIMEKTGAMTLTATEMEKDDDEDSNEDSGETTAEPAETTVAPATTTTTEAPGGGRKRRATDELKTNDVMVSFVSLHEVDAAGAEVGASKENSQALAAFTEVTFTFGTTVEDSMIPNSKNKDNEKIAALEQTYETNLQGAGKLVVFVYIAKEAGNISLGMTDAMEMTPVEKGQIKFSVHLEGWVWCTETAANCMNGETKEVGAALEMVMKVKGAGDAEKADDVDGMAMTFKIGNDNHLFVSSKVAKTPTTGDAEWVDMADTFPKYEKDGADTTKLTIRLPTFEKSVLYDPSVRLMIPGSPETSASTTIAASMGVLIGALLVVLMRL